VIFLTTVRIEGFRSIRSLEFSPEGVCALVGEAGVGKSVVLDAIARFLRGEESGVEADLAGGRRPACVFLPAASRTFDLAEALSPGRAALGLVDDIEVRRHRVDGGAVYLIEEPELYLRPHAQRYLYRLLHDLADAGNQVIYSTHAPEFLDVTRLEELALVRHDGERGTYVHQPGAPSVADEDFKVMAEFDAERAELFLARGALLVEGRTEKLAFPFVFRALGQDVDRQAISIVECGGKSRIALFADICERCEIPFVAVHDRDSRAGGRGPIPAERALNDLIRKRVGDDRLVVLDPDFEAASGLRGHRHKPERAWMYFSSLGAAEMPAALVRAASMLLQATNGRGLVPPPHRRHRRRRHR
jgi:predicted ATP-dependent endonuclease of OLD family